MGTIKLNLGKHSAPISPSFPIAVTLTMRFTLANKESSPVIHTIASRRIDTKPQIIENLADYNRYITELEELLLAKDKAMETTGWNLFHFEVRELPLVTLKLKL